MLVLIIAVLTVMLTMVLPSFRAVYDRLTGSLAASSYAYIRWAGVFCAVALAVMAVLACGLVIGLLLWNNGRRASVESFLARFPRCRGILDTSALFRFTSAAGTFLASGAMHAHLGVPGEDTLGGHGVSYCATCDGAFYRKKDALVIGGGDVAVEDAIFLARGCNKVYVVHRRDELRAAKVLQESLLSLPNVEMVWDSVAKSINGDGKVESVTVTNVKDGSERTIPVSGVFIAVGIEPRSSYAGQNIAMDEKGYILADETGTTNVPGVFAAGDVRKKQLRQVVTAVADGANAVTSVEKYLLTLK
jgi:hypothetical protein